MRVPYGIRRSRILRSGVRLARARTGLRAGGVLYHYPKSGSTWLRMMIANVASGTSPDFDSVRKAVPPIGIAGRPGSIVHTHEPPGTSFVRRSLPAAYLVRDPRDVFVSYLHHIERRQGEEPSQTLLLDQFLKGTIDNYGRWDRHVEAGLDRCLVVRYEDLLDQAHEELRRVCDHFELTCDADDITRAVQDNTPKKVRSRERTSSASDGFVRTAQSGSHQRELTEVERAAISSEFGPMMSRLGYDRD